MVGAKGKEDELWGEKREERTCFIVMPEIDALDALNRRHPYISSSSQLPRFLSWELLAGLVAPRELQITNLLG